MKDERNAVMLFLHPSSFILHPCSWRFLENVMKKILVSLCCVMCLCAVAAGQDITNGLEPIGPVSSFTKTESAVTYDCQDGSQVRVYVLAPDLLRVRASFRKPLPEKDHSWAIEKTSWEATRWSFAEQPAAFTISTDEVEVVEMVKAAG